MLCELIYVCVCVDKSKCVVGIIVLGRIERNPHKLSQLNFYNNSKSFSNLMPADAKRHLKKS